MENIVEAIRSLVMLTPTGSRLKGLCPFHEELTPSFHVSPRTQLFHCFGCGVGGNVLRFRELWEAKLAGQTETDHP